MSRKYVNYAVFAIIVAIVVGLAVSHSRHMRSLVDAIASSSPRAPAAADELIKREQFADSFTGESITTRERAVDALVALGTPDAVGQLDGMLKDADKPVRDYALQGIVKIAAKSDDTLQKVVDGIKEGDANQRQGSVKALQILGSRDPAVAARIIPKVCAIMKKEGGARSSAGDVLGGLPAEKEQSVKELATYLADKDDAVVMAAEDAMGKVGSSTAIPYLLEELKKSPQVHRVAISAIARIGTPTGERALTNALANPNEDNEARAEAATGLGLIATPSAIQTLIRTLDDYDLKVRLAAVGALAHAGKPAVGPLLAALHSPKSDVRQEAAEALGRMQDPTADAGLTAATHDSDAKVRVQAALALGFQGNIQAVQPLVALLSDRDGTVAEAAADALGRIGQPAQPALTAALSGPETIAYLAARALSRMGESAVPDLERAASGPPGVQRWAVVALGSIGGRQAATTLQKLAQSPDADVRASAEEALQRIGAPQAQ